MTHVLKVKKETGKCPVLTEAGVSTVQLPARYTTKGQWPPPATGKGQGRVIPQVTEKQGLLTPDI